MNEREVTEGQLLSQDFGVGGPPAVVEVPPPSRTVETVTLEIRTLQHQAQGIILNYAIEIGRRLEEAKAMLPHGEWGAWLKKELDYSQSTAQNFMRVFREYGDSQQSLFGGEAKSQMFGNLTYSKALRLLAIPDEEEREKFVAENDVERMSIRELNEALKARNEAEERATVAQTEADQAKAAAKAAQEALDKQRDKAQRLQDALSEANTAAQAAEEEHASMLRELEELRNRPAEADTAAVEAARRVAVAQMTEKVDNANSAKKQAEEKRRAAEEALEAAKKELADLKAREPEVRELTQEEKDALTAGAVEQAKAEGAKQIRGLEKQLAAANPNVAEFKVRFASWQEEYQKMMEVLNRIAQANEEQAAKLQQAVRAALEQMGGDAT